MSKRTFGRVDKLTEAAQIKTLTRGQSGGVAGQSHNALTLHAEVADIFDITSSQVLNADASLAQGDIIIADSNPNWTILAHPGMTNFLQTDATDVVWDTDLTVADGAFIGLGSGAGRLSFTDAATDVLAFQNCNVGVGTTGPDRILEALDTTNPQLRLTHTDDTHYADFQVGSGGNLTVTPTGDFIFDPTGNDILPQTPYDLNIGSLQKRYLTLHAAELWVQTLVAQSTIATIGGRVIVAPTTLLAASAGSAATSIIVKHNEMTTGDRIIMEASGHFEAMSVDSAGTGVPGAYAYDVTRDLDGTGANDWYAGDAVVNTGAVGDGFIDIYSVHGVTASATTTGPTIVGNVRNSTTYNDWSEYWAIGNLDGVYGYGTTTYGAAFGEYSGSAWVTMDPGNGIRFYGEGGTQLAQLSGSTWTLGVTSSEHFIAAPSVLRLADGSTTYVKLSACELVMGNAARENITFTSTRMDIQDGGTVYGSLSASRWTMGKVSEGEYVAIEASGISLFGNNLASITLSSNGDARFGIAASDQGNMKYDYSVGQLQFRGGSAGTDVQAYIDVDGSITAGGSIITLNSDGLQLNLTTSYQDTRALQFLSGGTVYSKVDAYTTSPFNYIRLGAHPIASLDSYAQAYAECPTGRTAYAELYAKSGADTGQLQLIVNSSSEDYMILQGVGYMVLQGDNDLRVGGGMTVGTTTVTPSVGAIHFAERSSDPGQPSEGHAVIWMSDGTGKGADGDVMIASTAGGTTNYGTLFDHSGGAAW